jgi:hypothetical protein
VDVLVDPEHCGACDSPCGAAQFCEAGACAPGCAGKIIHVSQATGDDANDGCTPDRAMKTIGAAIAFATTVKAVGHAIHVCKGTYDEPGLTLPYPVSLQGSYNCTTWSRAADFGYGPDCHGLPLGPGCFPATNETVVTNSAPAGPAVALAVSGAAIDDAVTIDGFVFRAPPPVANKSVALAVTQGSPRIADDQILGYTPATAAGTTIGLAIGSGAAPAVTRSVIRGGAGFTGAPVSMGPEAGSRAIDADVAAGQTLSIHEVTLMGGAGVTAGLGSSMFGATTSGSIGLVARGSGQLDLANSVVTGGAGTSQNIGSGSLGVVLRGNLAASLKGNTIDGGIGACASYPCARAALLAAAAGPLTITENRLYGGDVNPLPPAPPPPPIDLAGVQIFGGSGARLDNNVVYAGNKWSVPLAAGSPAVTAQILGVDINFVQGAVVRNNTIFTGGVSTASGVALRAAAGTVGFVAQNNLLAGGYGSVAAKFTGSDAGIVVGCNASPSPPALLVLQDNVFFRQGGPLVQVFDNATPCKPVAYAGITAMESGVAGAYPAATVKNNARITGVCGPAEAACVGAPACDFMTGAGLPEFAACMQAVFATWSTTDNGVRDALGTGFALAPGVSCAIARGGVDLSKGTPPLTLDVFGAARTAPTSIGAAEFDPACAP